LTNDRKRIYYQKKVTAKADLQFIVREDSMKKESQNRKTFMMFLLACLIGFSSFPSSKSCAHPLFLPGRGLTCRRLQPFLPVTAAA
jgi:hypothetical protein